MKHFDRVCAYVDLDAILFNLESMKKHLKPGTKVCLVIKTDGYGHGAKAIAKEAEALDYVSGYAVATAEEALKLRKEGIKKPILILGYVFPYAYTDLIEQDVRFTVFKKDMTEAIAKAAIACKKTAKVHIKVDTAMSRIGVFPDDDGLRFVKDVLGTEGIEAEGIFTHFARAD